MRLVSCSSLCDLCIGGRRTRRWRGAAGASWRRRSCGIRYVYVCMYVSKREPTGNNNNNHRPTEPIKQQHVIKTYRQRAKMPTSATCAWGDLALWRLPHATISPVVGGGFVCVFGLGISDVDIQYTYTHPMGVYICIWCGTHRGARSRGRSPRSASSAARSVFITQRERESGRGVNDIVCHAGNDAAPIDAPRQSMVLTPPPNQSYPPQPTHPPPTSMAAFRALLSSPFPAALAVPVKSCAPALGISGASSGGRLPDLKRAPPWSDGVLWCWVGLGLGWVALIDNTTIRLAINPRLIGRRSGRRITRPNQTTQ